MTTAEVLMTVFGASFTGVFGVLVPQLKAFLVAGTKFLTAATKVVEDGGVIEFRPAPDNGVKQIASVPTQEGRV